MAIREILTAPDKRLKEKSLPVEGGVTDVPLAVKRALARSLGALFITSVLVSFLSYT